METELVLLLSMFPETSVQLENMLEAEQRQTLADVGRSTQEGLLESLQRLASSGVVTADQADAGPRTVWSLSEVGQSIAAEIKDRQ